MRGYGSLGSQSHPCSTSANKNTGRAACEWQTGRNKVNPKHLLQIQMWICKEVAVFSTSCVACNSRCCNARAVPKEVLTPLLFLVLLLFSIGAHIILVTYVLLFREAKPFEGFTTVLIWLRNLSWQGSGWGALNTLSLHPASAFFHPWERDFGFSGWFSPPSRPISKPCGENASLGSIIPMHFGDLRLCFSHALSPPPRREDARWVPDRGDVSQTRRQRQLRQIYPGHRWQRYHAARRIHLRLWTRV